MIMIHGIMPRSGTVYLGNIIGQHPGVYCYPRKMWESPFLSSIKNLDEFGSSFFDTYPANKTNPNSPDIAQLFGAAYVSYLYHEVPVGMSALTKDPRVTNLNRFFEFFPKEFLVVLIRDGRDVVQSTLNTWPDRSFEKTCKDWDENARLCMEFASSLKKEPSNRMLVKYEEVYENPIRFVNKFCKTFGFPIQDYPKSLIEEIPVVGSSVVSDGVEVSWKPVKMDDKFKPIGRWKDWNKDQKNLFKRLAGRSLISLRYEKDQNW